MFLDLNGFFYHQIKTFWESYIDILFIYRFFVYMSLLKVKGPFGNVVLVTLFVFFRNTCE